MKITNRAEASDSHWILFAVFPFFAGITAVRNYRASWAKNVLWAFIVFYGFTFAIGKESLIANNESDILRYVTELKDLYGKELTLQSSINLFKDSGEADVLRTFLAILISRFTDSQQILTGVFGFIFGFFFTRNVWYLIDRLEGKLKGMTAFLLIIYFFVNPFWHINGFRFNTAIHIFLYGLLPYLYEGKKKGVLICCLSLLVHFSFLLPVAVLLIYMAAGNKLNVYFGFFVFSIFVSSIDIGTFNGFIEKNVPEIFVERTKTYRDEDKINEFRQGEEDDKSSGGVTISVSEGGTAQTWYAAYYLKALHKSMIVILLGLFFLGNKKIRANKWLLRAYCFALLMFGVANIMDSLPSGGRFLMLASLIALSVIILYIQNRRTEKFISYILLALVPVLVLYLLVMVRTGLYSISINTVVGNPIVAVFTDYNLSLNDLIK